MNFPMFIFALSVLGIMIAMALFPEAVKVSYGHLADRQDMCYDKCCIVSEILFGKMNDFATPNKIVGSPEISFVGCSVIGRGMVINEVCLHQDGETMSDLTKREPAFLCKLS